MTSLVLMYVYFDVNGDIKAITPGLETSFIDCEITTFPLATVEMFLNAKQNPYDYYVKVTKKFDSKTYKIVKKASTIDYTRSLGHYLTKVETLGKNDGIVIIENNVKTKKISIELDISFKLLYASGILDDEEQENLDNFFNCTRIVLYLTKHNNPYHLIKPIIFVPKDLLSKEKIWFDYESNVGETSIYTKKSINGFTYNQGK